MKSIVIWLVAAIPMLFVACSNNKSSSKINHKDAVQTTQEIIENTPAPAKKYQIKSGTITFQNTMKSGGYSANHKSIVYFDDYGIKERKDTYDDEGNLDESFFSDGANLYLIMHKQKTAYDRGKSFRGTEYKFDWDEISFSTIEKGKAKKGVNETVAGKECEVFYLETDAGKSKFAGWNNITLLTEGSGSFGETVNRAIEIKEGPVDIKLFAVPDGYTLNKN